MDLTAALSETDSSSRDGNYAPQVIERHRKQSTDGIRRNQISR